MDNEQQYPTRWDSWLVDNGIWSDLSGFVVANAVTGTFDEMAAQVGCVGQIIERKNLSVYRLCNRRIAQEVIDEFRALEETKYSWDAYENFDKQSELHAWYSTFYPIYPSAYLVLVMHGTVEGHTVYCRTYRDMLGIVRLLGEVFPAG